MEPVELMGKAAAVAVTAALCGVVLRRGAPELALLLSLIVAFIFNKKDLF